MIPNDFATVQQLVAEGYFTKVAQGDQRAASYFARLFAYRMNPSGSPSGWGCLKKGGGANVEGYAEDAVVYGSSASDVQNVCDLVGGAGAPGATPQWNGPKERRTSDTWEAPRALSAEQMAYLGGSVVTPPTGPTQWTAAHSARLALLPADPQTIAEDFAYAFPDQVWGRKRAETHRPVSSDVIARKLNGNLEGYKVVPKPSGTPQTFNLTGQVFVPVTPKDHVGGSVTPPGPVVPPVVTPPAPAMPAYDDRWFIDVAIPAVMRRYEADGRALDGEFALRAVHMLADIDRGMAKDAALAKHLR